VRAVSVNKTQAGIKVDLANKVIDKLISLNLDPTPDIYTIWYYYFKGDDLELVKKINDIISTNKNNLRSIHFAPVVALTKREASLTEEFKGNSDKIIGHTYEVTQAIDENVQRLGEFIDTTSNDQSKNDQQIIKEIQVETKLVMKENARLQKVIQDERQKMIKLQEKLTKAKKELITDALTNVHNRRHFDISLERAIKETVMTNKPLSLFIFDIDHFKKFNDTHGHQVGDMVLKFVGQAMHTLFPKLSHHLFRYGGEEFAIIFDGVTKSYAMKYAIMLSNALSKKEITKKSTNETIGKITISGGVADRKKNDTVESIIARADIALYEAKNQGRNLINSAA